jgi:hypothetical protein
MSPYWQIKQIVTFEGSRYVDRCNIWGHRPAGRIWCIIMSLVLWIGIHCYGLDDLLAYIDDAQYRVNRGTSGPPEELFRTDMFRTASSELIGITMNNYTWGYMYILNSRAHIWWDISTFVAIQLPQLRTHVKCQKIVNLLAGSHNGPSILKKDLNS